MLLGDLQKKKGSSARFSKLCTSFNAITRGGPLCCNDLNTNLSVDHHS